jgi:colicin import membrane protein
MSEEKKESEIEAISAEDSFSEKTSVEETPKVDPKAAEEATSKTEDALKAAKESEAAAKEAEAAAKAAEEAKSSAEAIAKAEAAAKAAEAAEAAVKEALAKAEAARAEAEAAAEEEYKAIAAEVKADAAKKPDFTFKRQGEEIFRREMGEPEFFLDKKDRFPRPILTQDQQESLTREAEIPRDQTPQYIPEHVLSPEFAGVSNYERGVDSFLEETRQKLVKLKNDPDATEKEIKDVENEITYLESLHENFFIGMNVFRTAKGGRDKIKA